MIKKILSFFLIFSVSAADEDQFDEYNQQNLKLFNPFFPQKFEENPNNKEDPDQAT